MSRKQLRMIRKADTSGVAPKIYGSDGDGGGGGGRGGGGGAKTKGKAS